MKYKMPAGYQGRDSPEPSESQESELPLTNTQVEQQQTEAMVMGCFRHFMSKCSNKESDEEMELMKKEHLSFLMPALYNLPQAWQGLDASRPWFVYWIVHAVDLFGEIENLIEKEQLADHVGTFLAACQDAEGGFGGGPDQLPHLAPSYAAVMALAIVGRTDVVNRDSFYRFLFRVRDEHTGGFRMHEDGEIDMRGTYCAVASASLLGMITDELFADVGDYVKSCQNYDGGIAGERGVEAHGGYSFCGLAAVTILGQANQLNLDKMLHWCVHRQMSLEGGYQGRTNKLVDSCYSFWQGAALRVLHEAMRQNGKQVPEDHCWDDPTPLQLYVLLACQNPGGGLLDKPGKRPDYYHTCYSLSGFSASQWGPPVTGFGNKGVEDDISKHCKKIGPPENILTRTDPLYNISFARARKHNNQYCANYNAQDKFTPPCGASLPKCGGIGMGMWKFVSEHEEPPAPRTPRFRNADAKIK